MSCVLVSEIPKSTGEIEIKHIHILAAKLAKPAIRKITRIVHTNRFSFICSNFIYSLMLTVMISMLER